MHRREPARPPAVVKALLCAASLAWLLPGAALAHAHLLHSQPADGSALAASPPRVHLEFAAPATLTSLSLEGGGGDARKLGPLPDAPAREFSVDLPVLAPGSYTVKYRVLSADHHVMAGSIHFTIGGQ